MPNLLEHACVPSNARLVDALRSLEMSQAKIVLVTDVQRNLIGVLSDGDIRRALLAGRQLDSPVAQIVQRDYAAVPPEAGRAEVLDLMRARTLDQIPIVNETGQLLGLHTLHELIGTVERPNWAVIMAGGKGTRLRPITEQIPKPMIPVAGRPILERLVLHLVGSGIRRIFLSVNYLGQIVEQHFGDGRKFGCRIDYLRETQPLGTGGALSLLLETPAVPLLVLNGDLVTQIDVGSLFDFHHRGRNLATMGLREYIHAVPFGCVRVQDGRIIEVEEKPVLSRLINTGIYVLNPELLSRVPAEKEFPITRLFEDCVTRREPVGAYLVDGDWIDVGQRHSLKLACEGTA